MTAEIVGPDIVIALAFLVPFILGLWVAVDASYKPRTAFAASGTSRMFWIVVPLVLIVIPLVGGLLEIGLAIAWFASWRPKVVRAAVPQ